MRNGRLVFGLFATAMLLLAAALALSVLSL
jgi:hypothetical protein